MYHRIEFWRSLPSFSSAITTFYWVWICFMAYLLSLLLIPKSFLNFWHFFYWLGKNFFCSQKKPYVDGFSDWWCWLSKIYKNISKKCKIIFWNLCPELLVCAEMYKLLWVDLLLYCLCWCDVGLSHYAHHITTPPGFSGLATALR